MSAFTKAFYDLMVNDSTLTTLLGTYSGAPSVLTKRPLPPGFDIEAHGPYILSDGQSSDIPGLRDTKNSVGREITRDVLCFTDIKRSPADVDAIAERVRELFQRVTSTAVAGFDIEIAEVAGPIVADEEDALGRVVPVRWVLEEV